MSAMASQITPHKSQERGKMFPIDDVIMIL